MLIRSGVAGAELSKGHAFANEDIVVQPKQRPGLVSSGVVLFFCLTMLVLSVMAVARVGTIPQLPDLPRSYLPGNPLPEGVSCYTYSNEHIPRCSTPLLDNEVYFSFDSEQNAIINAAIPARAYTIGQLIVFWGAPTGIEWNDYTIYLYWGKRSALLYASSLQPDSRVEFILYEMEQQPASPWRGFRQRKY